MVGMGWSGWGMVSGEGAGNSDLYSGAPSAWFRLKFPHLTCGSLASSAVVLAVYNYTEFDQQVKIVLFSFHGHHLFL